MWILGSLPWDYTRSLCPEIVDRALSHRHAGIARRLLGGMPHAVIAEVVPPIMAQVLVEADYDEYRRSAELFEYLGLSEELAALCSKALRSEGPDIREVGEDYRRVP